MWQSQMEIETFATLPFFDLIFTIFTTSVNVEHCGASLSDLHRLAN